MTVAIAPVLKYPGAKWSLATWICEHFPPHRVYLEPFFGSGAVFFTKERSRLETINDLSHDVINLFRTLRDHPQDLAAAIHLTPWSREEHADAWAALHTGDPVEDARRFLVRTWQNHGMRTQRKGGWAHVTGLRAATDNGLGSRVPSWRALPDRILATVERLRDAQIEQRPALDVIARFAHDDCLIYCDPPYVLGTRVERQYDHELTDADHTALLDALEAHPGPVLLSGYACALYDSRLGHWLRLKRGAIAHGGVARTEALWLNPVAVRRLERANAQAHLLELA